MCVLYLYIQANSVMTSSKGLHILCPYKRGVGKSEGKIFQDKMHARRHVT